MSKSPKKVIRLSKLQPLLGVGRSAVQQLIKDNKLHPWSPTGGRAQVVDEDEVAQLQEAMKAEAKAKRDTPDAE
jgi:hypothetical protein